jgi:ADP-heptose:LPS heptosyltransferase
VTGPRRTLVIHTGAIGDFISTLLALDLVAAARPGATLEILGRPDIAALALGGGRQIKIRSIEAVPLAWCFSPAGDPPPELASYAAQFDLAVAWIGDETFARSLASLVRGPTFVLPPLPPEAAPPEAGSAVEHYLTSLTAVEGSDLHFSFKGPAPVPRVFLSADELAAARTWLAGHGADPSRPTAAFHPGSGGPAKRWPIARFRSLVGRLHYESGLQWVVLTGPAEKGDVLRVPSWPGVAAVADSLPLREVAALLACSAFYVGNDSGITHLAAAVGVPTLALFGPSNDIVWGPAGENVTLLRAPGGDMSTLEVDRVAAAARGLAIGGPSNPRPMGGNV